MNIEPNGYILTTIHRPNNTDDSTRLSNILSTLVYLAEKDGVYLVLPLHPRTKNLLGTNLEKDVYEKLTTSPFVKIIPPASFFDIIVLEKNAKIVMTDSGGVQKESFFFERPCVILRPETEWIEIIEHGAGIIADAAPERIKDAYAKLLGTHPKFPQLFGDAHAAEHILQKINEYLS